MPVLGRVTSQLEFLEKVAVNPQPFPEYSSTSHQVRLSFHRVQDLQEYPVSSVFSHLSTHFSCLLSTHILFAKMTSITYNVFFFSAPQVYCKSMFFNHLFRGGIKFINHFLRMSSTSFFFLE